MLTALLSTLQSSLTANIPKPFLVGSVLPIALFLGASFVIAGSLGGPLGDAVVKWNPLTAKAGEVTWNVTFGVVALMSAAMIWSGMIGILLELLEGRHLGWLGRWLHACERQRLATLDRDIDRTRRHLRALEASVAQQPPTYQSMEVQLREARAAGQASGPRPHDDPVVPPLIRLWARIRQRPVTPVDRHTRPLARVRWRDRLAYGNTYETLKPAVETLAAELRRGTSDIANSEHAEVLVAIGEARERLKLDIQRLLKERQFEFPSASNVNRGESAIRVLAPTRFGNVGLTIRSYAVDRYGLDLDIFWGRLQKVLAVQDKTYSALQDAKTQVDFVASLFWLTMLFVGIWTVVCVWIVPAPRTFLAVGTLGPIFARGLYLSAVQCYLLFADQVRSAVDLFRFELLTAMRVSLPPGNQEEPVHWKNLGEWIGYGNDVQVTYTEKR